MILEPFLAFAKQPDNWDSGLEFRFRKDAVPNPQDEARDGVIGRYQHAIPGAGCFQYQARAVPVVLNAGAWLDIIT